MANNKTKATAVCKGTQTTKTGNPDAPFETTPMMNSSNMISTTMGIATANPSEKTLVKNKAGADTVTSDEFYDFLIDKGALFGWYFLFMPVGKDPDTSLMPTPEQRKKLYETVQRVRLEKPLFMMDFWGDAPYVGGCIAGGRRYIHINPKGDVEPCIFVHFSADNIKEKSLKEALDSDFMRA